MNESSLPQTLRMIRLHAADGEDLWIRPEAIVGLRQAKTFCSVYFNNSHIWVKETIEQIYAYMEGKDLPGDI